MKRSLLYACLFLLFTLGSNAQGDSLVLRKGVILDSVPVRDSIAETFALYIPTKFERSKPWPVLFVIDMDGKGKEVLRKFKVAAEKHQYLLAASNNISDTLPISDNVLVANRLMKTMTEFFPIHKKRMYTAGYGSSGKLASVVPVFINLISGVISIAAPFPNYELLNKKMKFQFIGIVGREDYNFIPMFKGRTALAGLKIPNDLLIHDGGNDWPKMGLLDKALERFSLYAMKQEAASKDSVQIARAYQEEFAFVEEQIEARRHFEAGGTLRAMINTYKGLLATDTLERKLRSVKASRLYRPQKRELNNLIFKENLLKEDFEFSLLQDLDNLNYNNLGWWNYQMKKLGKYEERPSFREKQMGKRLIGYLNALIEDNIDIEEAQPMVDEEALSLLWMIKTLTDPDDYTYYLKIISDSSRYEDFGTALFYLEELLKQGYTDKEAIYALEDTALLRITPEFNKLIAKYLDAPRYKLNEQ